MVSVLLAVRHHSLRAALLEHLRANTFACEEAASAEDLWARLRRQENEILVLDLCLPQHTKLQTVRTIQGRYPNLPILVVSFAIDIPTRLWQDAGASGFVAKASLSTELIEAVKVISEGGKYFSSEGPAGTIR